MPALENSWGIAYCRPSDELGVGEFDALAEEWREWGYRLALKITGCHDAALDALQEACVKAYRARRSLREAASAEAWFRRIVVRCALGQKPRPSGALTGFEVSGEAHPMDRIQVQITLCRLKPWQRAILALAIGEGMSYAEIAYALGIPIGTVGSRLDAAKKAFRKQWGDER